MITCFSFKLNGWVNYAFPVALKVGVSAMPFRPVNEHPFAYAHKAHAEHNMMPTPTLAAIPYEWPKYLPVERNDY